MAEEVEIVCIYCGYIIRVKSDGTYITTCQKCGRLYAAETLDKLDD